MAKKHTEEAINNAPVIPADKMNEKAGEFNEFEGNVKHEGYDNMSPDIQGLGAGETLFIPEVVPTKANINVSTQIKTKADPSQTTQKNNIGEGANNSSSQTSNNTTLQPQKKEVKVSKGNKRMADAFIYIYAMSKQLTYNWTNLEMHKLESRALKGKFDMAALEINFPYGNGVISVKRFLDNYNFELKKCLYINPVTNKVELTDPKFIAMRDNLAEMLAEKGYEMSATDEFLFDLGMDILDTSTTVFSLNREVRSVLSAASEFLRGNGGNSALYLNQNQQREVPQNQQQAPPPPPPPPPDPNVQQNPPPPPPPSPLQKMTVISTSKKGSKKKRIFNPDELLHNSND